MTSCACSLPFPSNGCPTGEKMPHALESDGRRIRSVSLGALPDPLLAARVHLFLPERDRLLERIDRLVAGVERRGPVGGRDGDHDARLPDLDAADAVVD